MEYPVYKIFDLRYDDSGFFDVEFDSRYKAIIFMIELLTRKVTEETTHLLSWLPKIYELENFSIDTFYGKAECTLSMLVVQVDKNNKITDIFAYGAVDEHTLYDDYFKYADKGYSSIRELCKEHDLRSDLFLEGIEHHFKLA